MTTRRWLVMMLLVMVMGGSARAETLAAPLQASLLLKVLTYDRNLAGRAGAAVVVAVAYRAGSAESEAAADDVTAAIQDAAKHFSVAGLPVQALKVAYADSAGFEAALKSKHASALYLCPGLGEAVSAITKLTRASFILTFTASEAQVRGGVSIGLLRRETRASLLVNLAASRAEGANLESAFLRVAEIIQ
jgi:hypothetical protein